MDGGREDVRDGVVARPQVEVASIAEEHGYGLVPYWLLVGGAQDEARRFRVEYRGRYGRRIGAKNFTRTAEWMDRSARQLNQSVQSEYCCREQSPCSNLVIRISST